MSNISGQFQISGHFWNFRNFRTAGTPGTTIRLYRMD